MQVIVIGQDRGQDYMDLVEFCSVRGIKLVEEKFTSTNTPSDEILICRGGDDICKFKSISYRCRNPEWCSYKLKLSHVG